MKLDFLNEVGGHTDTQRRRIVPAPYGARHTCDVGMTLKQGEDSVKWLMEDRKALLLFNKAESFCSKCLVCTPLIKTATTGFISFSFP